MPLQRNQIDLTRYAWKHKHGDVTAYGTWLPLEDGGSEPCIALAPTNVAFHQGWVPCVVPLSLAYLWDIDDPNSSGARCAAAAKEFADCLKMGSDMKQVFQIVGIIHDHLGDLLAMKPEPKHDQLVVLGEAKITNKTNGVVIEREIIGVHQ